MKVGWTIYIGMWNCYLKKFKEDEVSHKNIAYEFGATNKGLYSIMNKIIKTGSRIAITISEKI